MCAVVMIVMNEICEQPFQMAFIHRNDVIQEVSSAAFNPTLRHSVLPRTLERSSHGLDGHRPNRTRYVHAVLRVPIKDQEPGTRSIRKCFPQLLDDPRTRRMPGDVEMQDAPPIVADDEEPVEHAERDVGTAKKSIAAIASRWLRRNASQRLTGSGFLGARFIQREIVLSETSKPSMRSAP